MKKEKKNIEPLSPYMNKIHLVGRISSLITVLTFLLVGTSICLHFDILPNAGQILAGGMVFFVLLLIIGAVEFIAYLPILGSGATYISFITGNISNMKVPAITSAMKALDVKTDTEEHEVLSIIASCVASLLVIVMITIVIIFNSAMTPLLEWAPIQPAFDYVLPAIYAVLALGAINKMPKVIIPTFFFGIIIALFTEGIVSSLALMFGCIIFAIVLGRVLYKKGIQKEVNM